MSELRVAVVGCGYWGPNLVRNLAATDGVTVAYTCDFDITRAERLRRQFTVDRATDDLTVVLEDDDVDAVVVATPTATHHEIGTSVLRAGKHLWMEKPLASSTSEAVALAALAEQQGLRMLVDHTFLYSPAVTAIAAMVRAGELGDVLYFDSVRINLGLFQTDANVLWDLGPHDISIAQHILGVQPVEVAAFGSRHVDPATENIVYAVLRYETNLIAHFHFNWLAPVKVRQTIIGGSRRMVVYDDLEPAEKVRVYDKGADIRDVIYDDERRRSALISYRTGEMRAPFLEPAEPLALAALDFVDSIRSGRDPVASAGVAVDVVRVLEAAQTSLARGGEFIAIASSP